MRLDFDITKESPCGIYVIDNLANGKFYIGQSINICQRFNWHRSHLRKGDHPNEHLQRAFNKYVDALVMLMVEPVAKERLNEVEQLWVDSFWGPDCYNMKMQACVPPPRKGAKWPVASIERMRATKLSRHQKFTPEHRQKIAASRMGAKHPLFGKRPSDETIAKIVAKNQKVWPVVLEAPNGKRFGPITNLAAFARAHEIHGGTLYLLVKGTGIVSQTAGWRVVERLSTPAFRTSFA